MTPGWLFIAPLMTAAAYALCSLVRAMACGERDVPRAMPFGRFMDSCGGDL